MNRTQLLRDAGQSLWLDNITREMLDDGTLRRYVDAFSITGLTSNPTIFDEAIGKTSAYDRGIRDKSRAGLSNETLFFELALEDLRRAADLFRPVFDATEVAKAAAIASGLPAGPGAASGRIYLNAERAVTAADKGEKVLLVRVETSPEKIPAPRVPLRARVAMTGVR